MYFITPTYMKQKVKVFYETAKGNEMPSLRTVDESDREDDNSAHHNYDFILRGEVKGWPTRNMVLYWDKLNELVEDIQELEAEWEEK